MATLTLVPGVDYYPWVRVQQLDDGGDPVVPVSVSAYLTPSPLVFAPTIDPVTGMVDLFVDRDDTKTWDVTAQPSQGLLLEVWFEDSNHYFSRVLSSEVEVQWPARIP